MALGPKQMGEAILRNLEEKTGKSLEQWLTIVKKSKLTLMQEKNITRYWLDGVGSTKVVLQ